MIQKRAFISLLGVVILLLGIVFTAFFPSGAISADQISNRSLTLVGVSPNGGSEQGVAADDDFSFTLPTAGDIESIGFQYCMNADNTPSDNSCNAPTSYAPGSGTAGTYGATLGSQTGVSFANITNSSSAPYNESYVWSSSPVTITTNETVTVDLNNVVNPEESDCGSGGNIITCTFYVRISTYSNDTASGTPIDSGNVAASVTQQIVLTGQMPESLVFCSGGTINETDGVPDCTTATSGAVSFNQLFSPTSTSTATSQMAASTNANFGYQITVNGPTLTSGSATIDAMDPGTSSDYGVSQFGMNLMVNTVPDIGTALTPADDDANYFGQPTLDYGTANTFQYNSGDTVANSSDDGGDTQMPTDAQIYTVSYVVNVPGNQPAGTYTTTLTYICTPEY